MSMTDESASMTHQCLLEPEAAGKWFPVLKHDNEFQAVVQAGRHSLVVQCCKFSTHRRIARPQPQHGCPLHPLKYLLLKLGALSCHHNRLSGVVDSALRSRMAIGRRLQSKCYLGLQANTHTTGSCAWDKGAVTTGSIRFDVHSTSCSSDWQPQAYFLSVKQMMT